MEIIPHKPQKLILNTTRKNITNFFTYIKNSK